MKRSAAILGWMLASIVGLVTGGEVLAGSAKYCVTGDMGTGRQTEIARALESERCDYILFAGDLVYKDGISDSDDSEYRKFAEPFGNLLDQSNPVKILLAVGNHDHRGNAEAWIDVAKRSNGKIYFPYLWYAKKFPDGVCIFGFDTNDKMDQQAAWFEKTKGLFKDCKFSMAFAHHPYLSAGKHGDAIGGIKGFLEDVVVGHFDLYAAGHDHHLEDAGEFQGTRFLVSGAGGELRSVDKGRIREWGVSQLGYFTLQLNGKGRGVYQFKSVARGAAPLREGEIPARGVR
jgi:hypothetical protein